MTSLKVISGCVLIAFLAVGQCSALRVEREERRKISVAADTRGRESRAAALPCRAARRETAHTGNAFVPVCTKAGNYRRRQCNLFRGQCWCVDPVTGTEIRGTRQRLGMITCHKNAPLSKHGWLMEKKMFMRRETIPGLDLTTATPSADQQKRRRSMVEELFVMPRETMIFITPTPSANRR